MQRVKALYNILNAAKLLHIAPRIAGAEGNEMTPVQANCLKVAIKRGDLKLACYLALLANADQRSVYLPNAYEDVKDVVTKAQWSGYLGLLAKEGKYAASQDDEYQGWWGYIVKAEEA